MNEFTGMRVAKALNYALSHVDLTKYDYLLRIDEDTIIPQNFLEESINLKVALVGEAGYAMLIKVPIFTDLLNGKFPVVPAEDSYLIYYLLWKGEKVSSWKVPPIKLSTSMKTHSWRYFYTRGKEMYKLGYEPLHVIKTIMNTFSLLGYMTAALLNEQKYQFSQWLFKKQLSKILEINKKL